MKINSARRAEIGIEKRCKTLAGILEAILAVLKDKSFDEASIEDFIALAGVSRGTFYNYFKNKGDVALAVATISNLLVEESISEVIDAQTSTLEGVTIGLVMYLIFADQAPNLAEVMFHEYLSRYPQHFAFVDSTTQRFTNTVQQNLSDGIFDIDDLDVAQDITSGALAFLVSRVSSIPKKRRTSVITEGIIHLLMALGVTKLTARKTVEELMPIKISIDNEQIKPACYHLANEMIRASID